MAGTLNGKLRKSEAMARAIVMRKEGGSLQAIADELTGGDQRKARRLLMKAIDRLPVVAGADQVRTIELERLDVMHSVAWKVMLSEDFETTPLDKMRAIIAIDRIMVRRAALLGLDKQTPGLMIGEYRLVIDTNEPEGQTLKIGGEDCDRNLAAPAEADDLRQLPSP